VCVCVCLSVCEDIYGTARAIFTIFMHVAYAVAWSSSGVFEISYALPVLWMASCFFLQWAV